MTRQLTTLSLLALLTGCTTQPVETPKPAFDSSRNPEMLSPDLYPSGGVPEKEPVVRYGRYTLVTTQPDAGQRDLMAQIIDVTIPSNMNPSVRDAMQYVVERSGYALCPASSGHVNILYTRPLPAAQYKLGPMTLRNTLQVLAGPAWQVKVDEVNRQVCFVLRPGYQLPEPPRPAPTMYAQQPANTKTATPAPDSAAGAVVVAAVPSSPAITTSAAAAPAAAAKPAVLPPVAPAKDGPIAAASPSSAASKPASVIPGAAGVKPGQSVATATQPAPVTFPAPILRPLPQVWTADSGSTLRQSVGAWAKKANWTLIWSQDDLDYPIQAPLRFEGSFEEAIKQLFPLYDTAQRSFVVDGSDSQRVLHVDERKKK
ncbi:MULTISPECIES: TcpQ domain-containing protein [Pseudomonas]|uniref:PFGI-1 class ICE element type IV pilus protein PilL2 n=1 Tax=Pseudomonas TaxID=286 RepID=UPI0006D3E163|nr:MULTISPECIES: TcpQ domain-containing protein [Pseudomonas]MDF3865865.1 TcpQ domain-containing protein [Pseudomonas denitrificans (nom. rej.)]NNN26910.1 pilus assembly protein PilL [Pseudomonas nitroreducens]OBY87612.1 pilus assembly protein PilL [Pseudomonas sp. AU11447]